MKNVLLPSLLLLLIVSFVNGSRKPLLLISMDGMRSSAFEDFLKENPDSTFHKRLINTGLKADYVTPIFPSLTFPNHWSIVTGVYAEQHGIVGNQIYDPTANIRVSLSGGSANANEVRWWNRSDPIWMLAKKKSLKTAASFWPGSEVWSRTPDIFLTYSNLYSFESRIDQLINWFLKFNLDFACIYFNEPDSTGHTYGPNNQYYKDKVKEMNGVIGYLFNELERNNLLDNMNVILTGDHGMAQSDRKPTSFVDYMDTNLIDFNRSVINFVSSIYPKDMSQLDELYQGLQKIPNATVYYKNDVPPRFHYTNSDRIGPIVLVAEEGFLLSSDGSWDGTKGSHGYDNQLASMRTIFLATGPDFKKGVNMPGFETVNIQPLMCKLLDLESSQSSGSVTIFEPYLKSFAMRIDRISALNYFIFILAIISFVNSSTFF